MHYHAKFRQNRSKGWKDMAIFRVFKIAAVHHFGFSNFGNFKGWLAVGVPYASPCQMSSKSVKLLKRYGDFSIFFQMHAVHHLGVVWRILGPPVRSIYHRANFGWNPLSSFYNMEVSIFRAFGWEMPIQAHNIGFLKQFDPLNGEQYQPIPPKAHSCVETRRMTYKSSKSVHWCDLCAWLIRNQEKKKNKEPR